MNDEVEKIFQIIEAREDLNMLQKGYLKERIRLSQSINDGHVRAINIHTALNTIRANLMQLGSEFEGVYQSLKDAEDRTQMMDAIIEKMNIEEEQ